ncbi:hypothetical protein SARC_04815 [Sphaeroforma arctica JP610]|uniref:Uncharacterized protein n=1 Tax=Sphaeroforma arctica JP610 TaxID=667725 RepID=A0A0L0G192_9EUKA|nr:hypothetical protein SARC_04815 [Sphaeroforma arctica JP610]KNC82922.1 hypothetical protein SARC_04815 [Sphaeroforma arctica JP610]|eukprot:XP_014156824.1 hypothetical protein SARC_04815 [Sphaeroforma arctica JP610]
MSNHYDTNGLVSATVLAAKYLSDYKRTHRNDIPLRQPQSTNPGQISTSNAGTPHSTTPNERYRSTSDSLPRGRSPSRGRNDRGRSRTPASTREQCTKCGLRHWGANCPVCEICHKTAISAAATTKQEGLSDDEWTGPGTNAWCEDLAVRIYNDKGTRPVMLTRSFVISHNFSLHTMDTVYISGFAGDGRMTINTRTEVTLLLEVLDLDGKPITLWVPDDCDVLLGLEQLQTERLGIGWDESTSLPTFRLQLPRSLMMNFLAYRPPEILYNLDRTNRDPYIPDSPLDEYDFTGLDYMGRIRNMSPAEVDALQCNSRASTLDSML